jgi:hypothetical protein
MREMAMKIAPIMAAKEPNISLYDYLSEYSSAIACLAKGF